MDRPNLCYGEGAQNKIVDSLQASSYREKGRMPGHSGQLQVHGASTSRTAEIQGDASSSFSTTSYIKASHSDSAQTCRSTSLPSVAERFADKPARAVIFTLEANTMAPKLRRSLHCAHKLFASITGTG